LFINHNYPLKGILALLFINPLRINRRTLSSGMCRQ
jgi:hypothetical protein